MRRHIRTGRQAHRRLTSLISDKIPWVWGEHEESLLQEVRDGVAQSIAIGTPLPGYEMVLITDSSKLGGGGGLWQWQPIDPENPKEFGPSTKVNSKGELMPEREDFRLVPLGHWGWKWSPTRKNYGTWEQEVLSGVLLLSSQDRTLRYAPSIVWLCDQSAAAVFREGDPPTDPRRLRWWTYIQTLPLQTHHIPGAYNEFPDFLSRQEFAQAYGDEVLEAAEKAFQTMDVHLDLFMRELSINWNKFGEGELSVQREALKNDIIYTDNAGTWAIDHDTRLTCERLPVVPRSQYTAISKWGHEHTGHPGRERTLVWLLQRFYFAEEKFLEQTLKDMISHCALCLRNKPLNVHESPGWNTLPLPHMANSMLYIDFIEMPARGGFNFLIVIMCALSLYARGIACRKTISGEELCELLWKEWFSVYGIPAHIIADSDVRWGKEQSWWKTLMRSYGVKFDTSIPYKSRSNGVVERRNREMVTILRMLQQQQTSSNWVKLIPLATCILNEQVIGRSGKCPAELFLNRVSWHAVLPENDVSGNPAAVNWIEQNRQDQITVRDMLLKNRRRQLRSRRVRPLQAFDWVLVHHTRFPGLTRNKLQERWLGPFLVLSVNFNSVEIKVTPRMGKFVKVSQQDCRRWPDEVEDPEIFETTDDTDEVMEEEESPVVQMPDEEAEKLGFYEVDEILSHRYRRRWEFETTWKGYSDKTFEPISSFILSGNRRLGPLSGKFMEYCQNRNLQKQLQAALKLAAKS